MPQIEPDLVEQAKQGDETALAAIITSMMPVIRKGAASCTAPGLDFEDAVQEGMIGLMDAVHSYVPTYGAAFAGYAAICIGRAQQDARRMATRKKHAPLNYSVPIPADTEVPGPEELTIVSEEIADTLARMEALLSPLEHQVLLAEVSGSPTAETARLLGRTPKTVANALARARRKLRDAQ